MTGQLRYIVLAKGSVVHFSLCERKMNHKRRKVPLRITTSEHGVSPGRESTASKDTENKRMNEPQISVIIPCYNHGRYLPEAVASVVAQTFDDWELIIVDDGSTDDSAAVAERLIATYSRHSIHLLRQTNQGLSAS